MRSTSCLPLSAWYAGSLGPFHNLEGALADFGTGGAGLHMQPSLRNQPHTLSGQVLPVMLLSDTSRSRQQTIHCSMLTAAP